MSAKERQDQTNFKRHRGGEPEAVEGHADIHEADPVSTDGDGYVEWEEGIVLHKDPKANVCIIAFNDTGGAVELDIHAAWDDKTPCADSDVPVSVPDGTDGTVFDDVIGADLIAIESDTESADLRLKVVLI